MSVMALDRAQDDLFAQRVKRLEEVSRSLQGLRRELTACLVTERQQKAQIYEANMGVSHGERQGLANAQTADIGIQIIELKGQIEVAEEERDFLRFAIEWVAG